MSKKADEPKHSGRYKNMSARLRPQGKALLIAFDQLVKLGLRGVWVRGVVPHQTHVWATNHHHWWDAFAAASVLKVVGHQPTAMINVSNMEAFPLFTAIDAVPTSDCDRAVHVLDAGRSLVMMPEGKMWGPGPLRPIKTGVERISASAGVPVLPVATRVVVRASQFAEAFIHCGPVLPAGVSTPELFTTMSALLHDLDQTIMDADVNSPLPGYGLAVPGRGSIHERLTTR